MSNPCDLAISVYIINIIDRLSSPVILSGLGISSAPQGEGFLPPNTRGSGTCLQRFHLEASTVFI